MRIATLTMTTMAMMMITGDGVWGGGGGGGGGRRKVKLIKLTIDSWPEELSTHGVYRVNNRTTTLVTLLAAFRWHSKTNWVKGRGQLPRKMCVESDGHFRITFALVFKASPGGYRFIWKEVFIYPQIKLIFMWKVCARFDKKAKGNSKMGYWHRCCGHPALINVKKKCFLTRTFNSHRIALKHQR